MFACRTVDQGDQRFSSLPRGRQYFTGLLALLFELLGSASLPVDCRKCQLATKYLGSLQKGLIPGTEMLSINNSLLFLLFLPGEEVLHKTNFEIKTKLVVSQQIFIIFFRLLYMYLSGLRSQKRRKWMDDLRCSSINPSNVICHTSLGRNKTDEFNKLSLNLNLKLTAWCSATGG